MKFDLGDMVKPIAFEAPHIGRVEVDAVNGEFLDWYATLEEHLDGEALMRRILLDRAARSGAIHQVDAPAPGLLPTAVEHLTSDEIEAVAGAFLQASGVLFRPTLVEEERRPGARRRVRLRRSNETYDIAPQLNERETERLGRLLRAALQDRRDHDRLLTQDVEERVEAATTSLAGVDLSAAARMARLVAGSPTARLARLAAESPAMQAIRAAQLSPALRMADSLDQSAVMRAPRLLAESPALDTAAGIRSLSMLREHEDSLRKVGLLAQLPTLAMAGASLTLPKDLLGGGVYARMIEAAQRASLAADIVRRTEPPGIAWLADVNRALALGLSTSTIARIGTLAASDVGGVGSSAYADLLAYARPGWQAAAAVGVSESLARAAAAALLRGYDEASPTGVVFGAADELAHTVDEADENLLARLLELVRQGREAFLSRSRHAGDALEQQAVQANLTLLLTLAGLLVSLWTAQIAQTTLDVARQGATSDDVKAAAHAEIAAYREEGVRDRAAERDDDVRLRRVTAPTRLLIAPDLEAQPLQTVYPDELIRLIDERGQWVEVEVSGYRDETVAIGWLQRSCVRHR